VRRSHESNGGRVGVAVVSGSLSVGSWVVLRWGVCVRSVGRRAGDRDVGGAAVAHEAIVGVCVLALAVLTAVLSISPSFAQNNRNRWFPEKPGYGGTWNVPIPNGYDVSGIWILYRSVVFVRSGGRFSMMADDSCPANYRPGWRS